MTESALAPAALGGRVRYINLDRLAARHATELAAVAGRVFASGIYAGGAEVETFERDYAGYCGAKFAIGVANGLEAMELTLRAWGIGPGDDVVVPANTAMPTALAVSHTGARVVFADVETGMGLLTASTFEAARTAQTRAVIAVHLYGHPVDMDPICEAAARAGVRVLEDAAHAHGARYRGRPCGALADAAAFSFYPTKNLGAFGDAGCVTTDDAALAAELRLLRSCGLRAGYEHVRRGFNSRLDPLQAALLGWKLGHLDAWNARRRAIADRYTHELASVRELTMPVAQLWAEAVWHAFPVLVRAGTRDAVRAALLAMGIETNVHYRVPLHLQPAYAADGGREGDFPVAEARALALLSLPLDPFHTDREIGEVIHAIGEVVR